MARIQALRVPATPAGHARALGLALDRLRPCVPAHTGGWLTEQVYFEPFPKTLAG